MLYKKFFKRFFDLLFSLAGFIILSPIFILIIVLLLISNKRSGVFFTQQRPGLNGKIFKMIKFKTMTDGRNPDGSMLPDEKRLTKVGRILRSTSLDEIPQLINAIKGDMSIVGPRPLLPEYISLYNEFQARRHEVRPGITGWTQVNGRNSLSWQQKFEYDVWYVDNISLGVDMKIIIKTVQKVLKREGINEQGRATVNNFTGND